MDRIDTEVRNRAIITWLMNNFHIYKQIQSLPQESRHKLCRIMWERFLNEFNNFFYNLFYISVYNTLSRTL